MRKSKFVALQLAAVVLGGSWILPACAASPTKAAAKVPAKTQAARDKARIAALESQLKLSQAQVSTLRKQLAQMTAQSQQLQTSAQAEPKPQKETPAVLNFTVKTLEGKEVKLSDYAGKAILIVNTASKCGYTPQYESLEKLSKSYKDKGLVVLGFPSGDFGGQELDTDAEIATFCQTNYGVTFPLFAKASVKGEGKAPLFEYLTSEKTNPDSPGEIGWNFEKFLIDRSGRIAGRFKSGVKPDSDELTGAVEKALAS